MKKRILAAVIAAVFAVLNVALALPVFALNESTTRYPTPEGYNDHDYQKLVAFLEQTDDEGVKNGEKLSENYDPNDPATWNLHYDNSGVWIESDGELRIQEIYVSYKNLCGALDVSGYTALYYLDCGSNNLTSLDVSGCTALEELWCYNNNLTELDVSGCTALTDLICSVNNLTTLDVSSNTALEGVYCDSNNLTELDVSGCTALTSFSCYSNNLTSLDVSGCTALVTLWCNDNNLTTLDVSNNTALQTLYCYSNNLTELDVSGNTALQYLYCYSNNLTELDVSNNTALTRLGCYSNNLTELDVSNNTALHELVCGGNNLTELDLSNNPYLPFDYVKSEGNGTIGYNCTLEWGGCVTAVPNSGAEFIGWFNEAGELIASADVCHYYEGPDIWDPEYTTNETVLIAKFTEAEPIPGDADGDGELTSDDVLMLMRAVMGLDDITDDMLANCDMNGDGIVNFTDVLIMLRMVLNTQPNIAAC